ncbi:hypothetical protein LCGC14_1342510 [marine sediment metagenome]|uniref:Uncharacterized protein n=1 Tax=marine sediment metagenome TaxID=412755 RepID=A0A0F9KD57_9ZZZZ
MKELKKALILVHCRSMTGRLRLVQDHGFEYHEDPDYVQKVIEGDFTDILTYGQTLRGIRGLVSVKVDHTIPQDTVISE